MDIRRIARREFIAGLSGAAAWPMVARGQQAAMPVIGFLSGRSQGESTELIAAFRQGLTEAGYIAGHNVALEYQWADGQYDRLPALASNLVAQNVAVIVTTGGTASAIAAKSATDTTPIVFNVTDDPIKHGLVASLNMPGGNATGVTNLATELETKRLGLLHDTVPDVRVFAVLVSLEDPTAEMMTSETESAARARGPRLIVLKASKESEIDTAFASLPQYRPVALVVIPEPFFITRREQLVSHAARLGIPAIYGIREFAVSGGLMSYGNNVPEGYRQIGSFAGKVLKGANPRDLPVQQSAKFEFVINLRTAKALGLTIPSGIFAIADEVIE